MGIKKTLGGDRLGAGKKMQVDLHNFERSTHDLGRIFRSTMSAGTLVPFLVEYALPGDVFDIDLGADVKTYPTIGPLFGSFKLQLDVFQAPLRLYNAQLHNNALGIGMNMSRIKLPLLNFEFLADNNQSNPAHIKPSYGKHINSSCIHAYLGIRGFGKTISTDININVEMNAIPYIAYWDIYKNYYANKQEEIGMVIHGENAYLESGFIYNADKTVFGYADLNELNETGIVDFTNDINYNGSALIKYLKLGGKYTLDNLEVFKENINDWVNFLDGSASNAYIDWNNNGVINLGNNFQWKNFAKIRIKKRIQSGGEVFLSKFALGNIDEMRTKILSKHEGSPLMIDKSTLPPYGLSMREITGIQHRGEGGLTTISSWFSQEGLGIKTYQSDIFNNWLSTEWIDGTNGINEITAVDTSDGSFSIDTLNLANKVYNMLNRIAVSGGSYDDWIEANWAHSAYRRTESPIYHGGLSKEIVFQEVVSMAETNIYEESRPLGSLAGKGGLAKKHKGGKVSIKIHEPSVIIGLVSITPRVDYSQGNEWHINLRTMDDFHKPGLDQIGFQELITEQMAEWDVIRNGNDKPVRKSAGKQPAWINYMTSFNKTYGNFADPDKEMYMTLNRRYEYSNDGIKDLTTYIDPSKFNYLFAESQLSAMNFWVQIGMDITARRKMSAKVMPNL